MKAIVCTKYGPPDVLQLKEVQKPTPSDDEVLVEVHAASVNYPDWSLVRGKPFAIRLMSGGLLKPKHEILGSDIAGRVEAVGRNVKQFQPSDEVFGDKGAWGFGGFAEHVAVPENTLALKPTNISFEEAAAVPMAAVVALQGLRDKGQIQPGQKVLINGASGGIGSFAVQIAKSFGAEVTGVCGTRNLDMVRSIGADKVIDYTQEDFTKSGQTYDIIFDAVGKSSFSRCKSSLKQRGIYLTTVVGLVDLLQVLWTSMVGSKKAKFATTALRPAGEMTKDLIFVRELMEAGKLKPVIDRRYPLEQIAEAHRYVEKGHKKGNVVITVVGSK